MDDIDLKLSRDCDVVADTAAEAVRWIRDVAPTSPVIERLSGSLIGELQRVRNQGRKLAREPPDPLHALILRAELLVKDDLLQFRHAVWQHHLTVLVEEELRV